ncbi:MAG TPA: hypothetical protein VEC36_05785 [Patescibacteria group bacterium]|nr:hypothetical protein [Patescibacteria group bacterium]
MCVILSSCTIFETRSPEEPTGGSVPFQQPTSKDIVVNNFKNAVSQRSEYNFISCFDTSATYIFEPSSEARPSFSGRWTLEDERRSFVALVSKISPVARFNVLFANSGFSPLNGGADSVVFITDYVLRADHSDSLLIPTRATGTLSFTIAANRDNGLWAIRRWTDTRSEDDSVSITWSFLKGYFR